jgi:hypothetical protein
MVLPGHVQTIQLLALKLGPGTVDPTSNQGMILNRALCDQTTAGDLLLFH